MKFNKLAKERKILVFVFAFVALAFISMAFFLESSSLAFSNGSNLPTFDGDAPVEYSELSNTESEDGLKAIVKGSIYEEGDNMTVYGACFDNRGNLFPEADTYFTAWYPNGTIMVGPNATMLPITEDYTGSNPNGTGRWKIHVTMGDTLGTYLTEMRCEYNNQVAVAFGEWQNPAWVQRIRTTQSQLLNASSVLDQFRNETNNNLSSILSQLGQTDVEDTQQIRELANTVRDIDRNTWVLDADNPFYVLNSGIYNFKAVDMLSDDNIAAASSDGYFVSFDGESWTDQESNNSYRGISILPANQPYAWVAGQDNNSNPIIAVNGGSGPSNPPPNGSATAYNDVKLFQDPLNPAGNYYTYVLANDGALYFSNDSAQTWSNIASLDASETGRISQVVENYGSNAQTNGYMALIGQGNTIVADDGATPQTFNVTGEVKDTALLYHDYGYVVTKTNTTLYIYKWNGNNFTEEFSIDDVGIQPVAVDIHSKDDVWVATNDPSSFLHFNGRSWSISKVGYSEFVTVLINFNGNLSNDTGIRDMRMVDSRHGYAVGGDGLILEYQSEAQRNFQTLEELITNIESNLSININETELALREQVENLSNQTQLGLNNIELLINDTKDTLLAVNQSINTNIDETQSQLASMNATLNVKLDNILTNVTFTNQYLQTTIFPTLNATYQNTLQILTQLGVIEGQLNTTIDITNETRSIVNESAQDIDVLRNRSDQDEQRIEAWITQ